MDEHKDDHTPEETPNDIQVKGKKFKKILLLPAHTRLPVVKRLLQNKWTRIGVMAVVAVPMVGLLAWWGWSNSSFSKLGVDAALVEGSAQFRLSPEHPWDKLQEGMSLAEGLEVRTLENSRAVLNIDDGSAVRLNSESSVVLTKLTARHIVITNTGGDVYTRVVKSDDRTFEVKAGQAVYESLGTAYRTFNTDKKKGVEVYHSKVSIVGLNTDGTVLVEQGKRYYLVNSGAADLEGKVTELSVEELAADEFVQWNSEQDKKDFDKELGILFDLQPPALEVTTPANGAVTESESIEVKGTVESDATVLVNGAEITNNDGQFATTLALNEGANGIQVEARDSAGNKTVKNLTVTRTSAPAAPQTTFKLTGTSVDKGISFSWNISGISVPSKGFKLVKGSSANPTYSSKNSVSVDASKRSYTWGIKDGKTYHFRICTWNGETCTNYSNSVSVTAPTKPASTPPTGSITLSHNAGTNDFSWSVAGGTALYGFKLVWSGGPGPTYPGSSAKFYDKSATSGEVDDSGNLYVRICMYHDDGCINYSNELHVTIP